MDIYLAALANKLKRATSTTLCVGALGALTACGGGVGLGSEPSQASVASAQFAAAPENIPEAAIGADNTVTLPAPFLTPTQNVADRSASQSQALLNALKASAGSARVNPPAQSNTKLPQNTSAASTGEDAGAQVAAGTVAAASVATVLSGTSAASIAAVVPGCGSINLNTVYSSTLPSAGYYKCYQYVINAKSKIDTQVALPAGISSNYWLYFVDPTTNQWVLLDSDATPNNPALTQVVGQYARIVLAVAPTSGTGGQTFQFAAFNRPGFDALEANDKSSRANELPLNSITSANIDVAGVDQDYYFYPLYPGQTSFKINATFNSTQSVGVSLTQKTSTNTYVPGTESLIPIGYSGQPLTINNLPGNAWNSTYTYGIMVHVKGINTNAPASQPYTLRVGNFDVHIFSVNIASIEQRYGLTNYSAYPNPIGPHLTMAVGLVDSNNNPITNEPVSIKIYSASTGTLMNQSDQITSNSGAVGYVPNTSLAACGISPNAAPYLYFLPGPYYSLIVNVSMPLSNISYTQSVAMLCNTGGSL